MMLVNSGVYLFLVKRVSRPQKVPATHLFQYVAAHAVDATQVGLVVV